MWICERKCDVCNTVLYVNRFIYDHFSDLTLQTINEEKLHNYQLNQAYNVLTNRLTNRWRGRWREPNIGGQTEASFTGTTLRVQSGVWKPALSRP